jgi:hypothetical protein
MSHYREPVIGDDFDLETYGRPQAVRTTAGSDSYASQRDIRTVRIKGQATPPRRRPERSSSVQIDRYARRPDRTAQWALFMGVFMVVIAVVTGS